MFVTLVVDVAVTEFVVTGVTVRVVLEGVWRQVHAERTKDVAFAFRLLSAAERASVGVVRFLFPFWVTVTVVVRVTVVV